MGDADVASLGARVQHRQRVRQRDIAHVHKAQAWRMQKQADFAMTLTYSICTFLLVLLACPAWG